MTTGINYTKTNAGAGTEGRLEFKDLKNVSLWLAQWQHCFGFRANLSRTCPVVVINLPQ